MQTLTRTESHETPIDPSEVFVVHVFNDAPMWSQHERWWMAPDQEIRRLYVCSYRCHEDQHKAAITHAEREHPGCVFVY
jgi:hypothetical protein